MSKNFMTDAYEFALKRYEAADQLTTAASILHELVRGAKVGPGVLIIDMDIATASFKMVDDAIRNIMGFINSTMPEDKAKATLAKFDAN